MKLSVAFALAVKKYGYDKRTPTPETRSRISASLRARNAARASS